MASIHVFYSGNFFFVFFSGLFKMGLLVGRDVLGAKIFTSIRSIDTFDVSHGVGVVGHCEQEIQGRNFPGNAGPHAVLPVAERMLAPECRRTTRLALFLRQQGPFR